MNDRPISGNVNDSFDGISAIDANRTLIIDQYNNKATEHPELFKGANSLRDVFEYFKPSVEVEFKDSEGKSVYEELRFGDIHDFDVDGGNGNLVMNSPFLSEVKSHYDNVVKIRWQIDQNATLCCVLRDADARKDLKAMLKSMLEELDNTTNHVQDGGSEHPTIGDVGSIKDTTVGGALDKMGGFHVVDRFIPALSDMNPAKKASKSIFLNESRFEKKRHRLACELRSWIEDLLSVNCDSVSEYVETIKSIESELAQLLEENITTALYATRELEISYRALDLFYKNVSNCNITNLHLVNVHRDVFVGDASLIIERMDPILKEGFDRLDLRDSYSLLVIPGARMCNDEGKADKSKLLRWANMVHKYKVMLVTDHAKELTFDTLLENTAAYKDNDVALQNVIMTGNWIAGRKKESLSISERNSLEKALFLPPSTALAGKMYDGVSNMAQCAGGKKYGTLSDVKGVQVDLLKYEVAALIDNHIIPMVYSEGRVMAFNNNNLYTGDNTVMQEYPVVRVFDWIKKVLMNYVHDVAGETWDKIKSPQPLKDRIDYFLKQYQGYGNLFESFKVKLPTQDPVSKRIIVDIEIKPYVAAKNFSLKFMADKKEKLCEEMTD